MQFRRVASIATGLFIAFHVHAQISPSPNVTQLTPLGPQKHLPPGQQSPLPGVLMGYVYWDASAIQYDVNAPCQGFSITVSQGTPSTGNVGFEQFSVLGTYENNFSSLGKIGNYAVCQYAVDHLPENKDLKVEIHPSPLNFKTVVFPNIPPTANEPNAPIKIINGKCDNLPLAVPSASTLGSNWWTCGDHAYNVNYVLLPPKSIPGITGPSKSINLGPAQTLLSPSSSNPSGRDPGPAQKTLLPGAATSTAPPASTAPKNQH